MRKRATTLHVCLLISASLVRAADFYVSPSASGGGDGSQNRPWTLLEVLKHPAALKPGDTIYLRAGRYPAPSGSMFKSAIQGTQAAPITVRPYPSEHAIIDGTLEITKPGVIVRDLEIMSSSGKRVSSETGSWPTDVIHTGGINILAGYVKVINCVIHDIGVGISSWNAAPDRGHGHGLYAQNVDGYKYVTDNIVHNQFARGLQIYGTSATYLNNFVVEGNIVFNNGSLSHTDSRNILIGGTTVAKNPYVRNNYSYFSEWGDVNFGYYSGGAGCTNARVIDNYFAGGTFSVAENCQMTQMTGNVITGQTRPFSPSAYPNNKYGAQSALSVFVRPNKYEAGRANIAIFNWPRNVTVSVDVSAAGLQVGDKYELHNAENYFGDVTTGTYDGRPIVIAMTGRKVAAPIGIAAPPSALPVFGAFIIRKAGSVTAPPPTEPAPTEPPPAEPPPTEPTPTEPPPSTPVVNAWAQYLEGENGQRLGGAIVASDTTASGRRYASYPTTAASQIFKAPLPAAGKYIVWLRVRQGTFTISVAGGAALSVTKSTATGWHWERLSAPVSVAKGWQSLTVKATAAPGALDGVVIANDPAYVPPENLALIPR